MNPLVLGAVAVLLTACSEAQTPPASAAAQDTLVVSADPALREMAAAMLPGLAARSGLALRAPVRLELRTREELERFLTVKLDEELPPDRARYLNRAYHLLGMTPADLDLRDLLVSVYLEQVAGFYDPDSTTLFVLDDQPEATLQPLLLHELVHAVQDQWADLDSLTGPDVGNDRSIAAQAAIEGHATLVMLEYMAEQASGGPVDLAEIPDMGAQLRPARELVKAQYPQLASAPAVIQEGLLFPYLEGAGFVLRLWQALPERNAPFGEHLPQSTEQILDPARYLGAERDLPTEVSLEIADGEVLLDDVLGPAEMSVFLTELGMAEPGGLRDEVRGWDGDRWILVAAPDGGESRLVWAVVWDTSEDRDAFVDVVRPRLGRLPSPAQMTTLEVDGRPMLVLNVGAAPEVSVRLEGGAP